MRVSFQNFFRSTMLDPSRPRRWMMAAGIVSLVVLGPAGNASAVPPATSDPAGFVTTLGQRVIEVLDAQGLERDQRLRHFRDIFVHALDLDDVARRVLGRHWRVTSDAQRERYIALFRTYVVNMYAVQLGRYAGATFSVLRQHRLRENESLVIARFNRADGPPLSMNVRVRRTNERFRIIDATSLIVKRRDEDDEYGMLLFSDVAKKVIARDRAPERVNVNEVMSKPVLTVRPDMGIRYCARLFENFGISHAPVVENEKIVGIVSFYLLVLEGLPNLD